MPGVQLPIPYDEREQRNTALRVVLRFAAATKAMKLSPALDCSADMSSLVSPDRLRAPPAFGP
ncbi:hypothetical protein [Nocardia mikamii]|uniref:hypothetical protein n=1 Tax=Nocardia mikamii TaxID=508464 RepID=UPI0007A519EC|nr:hypothetical protein [Nocardia mikamii]